MGVYYHYMHFHALIVINRCVGITQKNIDKCRSTEHTLSPTCRCNTQHVNATCPLCRHLGPKIAAKETMMTTTTNIYNIATAYSSSSTTLTHFFPWLPEILAHQSMTHDSHGQMHTKEPPVKCTEKQGETVFLHLHNFEIVDSLSPNLQCGASKKKKTLAFLSPNFVLCRCTWVDLSPLFQTAQIWR